MSRQALVALALSAAGLLIPAAAHAHFKLNAPTSWWTQTSDGSPQKTAPCGNEGAAMTAASKVVNNVQAGQQVAVTVQSTIAHPGWWRISLKQGAASTQTATSLPDPPVMSGTSCTPAFIDNPVWSPTQPVLADKLGIPAGSMSTTTVQSGGTFMVTIPSNANCTSASPCTLQVLMFMTDHPAGMCNYHHCADIAVTGGATGTGGAGGATGQGGAGGRGGAGGMAGSGATGRGGTTGSGGASVTGSGGTPGTGGSGTTGTGGSGTTGTGGSGTTGTGGSGTTGTGGSGTTGTGGSGTTGTGGSGTTGTGGSGTTGTAGSGTTGTGGSSTTGTGGSDMTGGGGSSTTGTGGSNAGSGGGSDSGGGCAVGGAGVSLPALLLMIVFVAGRRRRRGR